MKKFRLRALKTKKYFDVIVYDTVEELRKAANDYDGKAGKNVSNDDILGICHPFERTTVIAKGQKGRPKRHPNIGILRFTKTHTTTQVVFHETMHAAFWQYRLSLPKKDQAKADFGESSGPKEEAFLHLADRLYIKMVRQMYRHKFWK